MLEYQIREIAEAAPDEKEEEELLRERERLLHADRVRLAGETALSRSVGGGGVGGRPAGRGGQGFRRARGDRSAREGPSRGSGGRQAPHRGPRGGGSGRGGADRERSGAADLDRVAAGEVLAREAQVRRHARRRPGARARSSKRERDELSNIEDALERRQQGGAARPRARTGRRRRSSRRGAGRRPAGSRRRSRRSSGRSRIEKARFRVALEPAAGRHAESVGARDGILSLRAQPGGAGKAGGEDRLGRRAVAPPARASSPWRRDGRAAGARSCSTRSTPESAGGRRRSSAGSSGLWPSADRSSA